MCPLYNFDTVWDHFTKLGTNKVWPDFDCELLLFLQFFSFLCHFVILYMVSIEIVSFCRIISLWNFQYRNHVHSITLMSFQIISQNLVQYKAWLDDVQRLRTVTSLDVSAVAGHHAMPAALLFGNYCSLGSQSCLKHLAKWVNEVEWVSKVKVILWTWSKVTQISKLILAFHRNSWAVWNNNSYESWSENGNDNLYKWVGSHDQHGHNAYIW